MCCVLYKAWARTARQALMATSIPRCISSFWKIELKTLQEYWAQTTNGVIKLSGSNEKVERKVKRESQATNE